MDSCGFNKIDALAIESAYHTLYKESDEWVQAKLQQASIDGYVTVAYGLRVRTPKIKSVVWGGPKVPYKAIAEGRTAGNALGQSYGLVNSRAAIDLQQRINKSKYRGMIHICSLIHDAIYLMFPDDVEIVKWINDNLIDCMESHGLPELDWHPDVKIGAELDLFYPDWSKGITLKNRISENQIIETVKKKLGG
jgi:DNA polymerase-1